MKTRYINPYTDLDFLFDDEREQKECISTVQLKDQFYQLFFKKLTYIFIELPRFEKREHELVSHFDKWWYFFKNLESFEDIPEILKEDVFVQGFHTAEISNFDEQQILAYEESLKVYRDLKGVIDTSYEEALIEGELQGLPKGRLETAKRMKDKGYTASQIFEITGLSAPELV